MSEATRVFLDAVEPTARGALDVEALAGTLAELTTAARAAWPGVEIADATFAAHLGRLLPAPRDLAALAAMRAPDLYLCCACAEGQRAALDAFERAYFGEIEIAARRTGATATLADEAVLHMRSVLFTASADAPPAVARFAGRGDLRGWVSVAATRALVRMQTRERREVRTTDDSLFDAFLPADDPELGYLKSLYRDQFLAAFHTAIAALPARDKALLRYSLLEDLTTDEIGELYGVHRITAGRWLARARDEILERTRDELKASLGADTGEVDSVLRLVHSRIEISLARVLGAEDSEATGTDRAR